MNLKNSDYIFGLVGRDLPERAVRLILSLDAVTGSKPEEKPKGGQADAKRAEKRPEPVSDPVSYSKPPETAEEVEEA